MTDQGTNEQPAAADAKVSEKGRTTPPAPKISGRDLLSPLAIIVAGLMISGSIVWTSRPPVPVAAQESVALGPPTTPSEPPPPPADIAKVNLEGEPFIGDVNAPVVMAYWFDYQCPYCRQEEENVFPQLIKDYVDTGKVRIVFKDFQFLGPDSQTAGLAGRAVWETAPDKFREWHKAMFDNQDDENAGWGKKEDIIALTKTIAGIDAAKVEDLMTSRAADYNTVIQADAAEGNTQGVGGTPSFVIGQQIIVGAQPYESLKAAIDAALNAQ